MINFKIPISFGKKVGLLVGDADVDFVSWKNGEMERIAIFSNDDAGLSRFVAYLEKNASAYKNASFSILANVIGEDYRMEKIAHLIGKYKTDFHNRRMQQLFRGVSLCLSEVQGREERGRREDIVLFYGMLTEGKVLPWMQAIAKNPSYNIVGVHAVSFVNADLLKRVNSSWRSTSNLLMTIHEKGLLRQTHYDRGHVRFSRVSKISDENATDVASAIRKELERTIQYLNSLKIPISNGLDIQFICPANMVGQLRELVQGSEKIRFHFHDSSALAQSIGLRSAIGELGRDSSLSLHTMFSRIWVGQLASFNYIRYYWMRTCAVGISFLLVLYGIWGGGNAVITGFNALRAIDGNQELVKQRDALAGEYSAAAQFENPPSEPASIESVSKVFRVLSNISVTPGQLIYYFARGFEKNKRMKLESMRWYISGSASFPEGEPAALVRGEDIYQILEVSGQFLPVPNETYIDVANRAEKLLTSFEQRSDIEVEELQLPQRDLGDESLSGVLTEDFSVDAARDRSFKLRIIWKQYNKERIDGFVNDRSKV